MASASHQSTEPPPGYNQLASWLAVLGASLSLFCTVGYLNAFGVFQEFYRTYIPSHSPSDISWIGSISIFLLYAGSSVTGMLIDKVGPTLLLLTGSVGLIFALFMTSLCTKYYQLFLAQGVLIGFFMSFLFVPAVAVVSRRLAHRRGLALGIVIGGSSIGGVIWPIMLNQLLNHDSVSFGWTMRAVAFTMVPLLSVTCLTVLDAPEDKTAVGESGVRQEEMRATVDDKSHCNESNGRNSANAGTRPEAVAGEPAHEPPAKKSKIDFSMLRNRTYILLSVGLFLTYLGLFTPLFYVSAYAVSQGISSSTSFYLLAGLNACSFFGRVIPGHLADQYGHYNIEVICIFLAAVTGFCWTAATSLGGLAVWSLAYGFASGTVIALQSACAGKIAPRQSQGAAVGFLTGIISIPALVGTPISGQILDHSGYLALSMWTGATLLAGSVIVALARLNANKKLLYKF
ncbi:MAG: hypothetical protein Q9165_003899 [Trypethelium subeluteriae]